MTGAPVDGLPEGWDALSRADADALAPPPGAKERVRLKLAVTLGVSAGLGAAAGLASAGGAAATAAASAGTAAGSAPAEGLVAVATKALLVKKAVLLGVAAATAVTGGTAAYVEVREHQHAAAERQAVAHRARLLAPAPQAPTLPLAAVQEAPAAVEVTPPPQPLSVDSLASERALLDMARLAIAQGRLGDARVLLDKHAADYRDGRLVEEREALSIRLLVRQGRVREAQQRAASFRREHPHSIQLPVIDEAVRSKR